MKGLSWFFAPYEAEETAKTPPVFTPAGFWENPTQKKRRFRQGVCALGIWTLLVLGVGFLCCGRPDAASLPFLLILWLGCSLPGRFSPLRRARRHYRRRLKKQGLPPKVPLTLPAKEALQAMDPASKADAASLETLRRECLLGAKLLLLAQNRERLGLLLSLTLFALLEGGALFAPEQLVLFFGCQWLLRRFWFAKSPPTPEPAPFWYGEALLFGGLLSALAALAAALWCTEWSGLWSCGQSAGLLVLCLCAVWDRWSLRPGGISRLWCGLVLGLLFVCFTRPALQTVASLGSLTPGEGGFCLLLSLLPSFAGKEKGAGNPAP